MMVVLGLAHGLIIYIPDVLSLIESLDMELHNATTGHTAKSAQTGAIDTSTDERTKTSVSLLSQDFA
jgi:hypothetical protein